MFAAFSKHHAVSVVACWPRVGNRKGVVEKINHTAAQCWWCNLPDDVTLEQAQQQLTALPKLAAEEAGLRVTIRDSGPVNALETFALAAAAPGC